ncbi:Uncharacterised protein [Mycobacteroides abscessus]|nr:Uncharacterised protein [Mycobacteroides abscessus]
MFPLPSSRTFTGSRSSERWIASRCQAPGVTVVAFVPSLGPVPPPATVVMPVASASTTCDGEMRCTCESMPPAVRILPSPLTTSVLGPMCRSGCTPSATSGLPARPSATIRPSRIPTSVFTTPHQSSTTALVITVSSAPSARVVVPWAIDSRIDFPPPNTTSSPPKVRSSSTSIHRSVSPRRTWSPVVGP